MGPLSRSLPARAALIYFLGAAGWILISDHLLAALLGGSSLFAELQTLKGGAFVLVTSLLLYAALAAGERRRGQLEAARRAEEERARLLAEYATDIIYHYRLAAPRGFAYISPASTALSGYTPDEYYADPDLAYKLVLEEDRRLLDEAAAAPGSPLVLRWRHRDGRVIWTEHRHRPIYGPGGSLIGFEGIAHDVTLHKRAEEQLARALAAEQRARQAAEDAAARTARLQAFSAALAGALSPEQVVQVIVEHGAVAVGASTVVVAVVEPTARRLAVSGHSHEAAVAARALHHAPLDGPTPAAAAVRLHDALWLESPAEAARLFPEASPPPPEARAQSWLPLDVAGRAVGVVGFGYREARAFGAEERAFLLSLAQQCAQVLERARLHGEVHEGRSRLRLLSQRLLEAQEQERRHTARELHGEIGQVLTALKLNMHLLRTRGDQPGGAGRLDECVEMIDRLIQQVRNLALDLRPAMLDDLGLMPALQWYGARTARLSGLEVQVVGGVGEAPVSPEVATACFRIVQEALANVVRHARARHVTVSLGLQDALLVLSVHDDGVGFDVGGARSRAQQGDSLGLISMIERAELAAGWADINSSAEAGTEVWACFPVGDAGPPE